MEYSSELYRYLFDLDASGMPEKKLRNGLVGNYRTKRIQSGDLLEYEIYPIWNTYAEFRKAKSRETTESQKRQNAKDAAKRFGRKVHANFSDGCHVSLTYDHCATEAEACHDAVLYIRRLRRQARKAGQEIKYMYVVEWSENAERAHIHMFIVGADRDACEAAWPHGFVNADRLRKNDKLLTEICAYLTKGPRGRRRWNCSKNLEEPKQKTSDKILSRRKVAKICADCATDGQSLFEELNPGFRLIEPIEPKYSEYVAGAYIYVRMRRDAPDNRTPKGARPRAITRARSGESSEGAGTSETKYR